MVPRTVVGAIAVTAWLWPASARAEALEWRVDAGCCGVVFDGGLRGIGLDITATPFLERLMYLWYTDHAVRGWPASQALELGTRLY